MQFRSLKEKADEHTNLGSIDDLVILEGVEVVLDVHDRTFLEHPTTKEGVRRTLWCRARLCRLALRGR